MVTNLALRIEHDSRDSRLPEFEAQHHPTELRFCGTHPPTDSRCWMVHHRSGTTSTSFGTGILLNTSLYLRLEESSRRSMKFRLSPEQAGVVVVSDWKKLQVVQVHEVSQCSFEYDVL